MRSVLRSRWSTALRRRWRWSDLSSRRNVVRRKSISKRCSVKMRPISSKLMLTDRPKFVLMLMHSSSMARCSIGRSLTGLRSSAVVKLAPKTS